MLKKSVSLWLVAAMCVLLLCPAMGEGRVVLTIGELNDRTAKRIDGKDQYGMWRYLEDQLNVEFRLIRMTPEEYAAGLSNGDLPDIVVTDNNLSTILESGAALNVDPYLAEYCPNFLQGDLLLTYQVYREILSEEGGFYFFPARIGYNGIGYDDRLSGRGYTVRWDYYRELGYPPINSEDDYLNVLLEMHRRHPVTEEGYPTYLYGCNSFAGYDTAFRAELSVDYWAAYEYQNDIFTNEIFDGYTDPVHSKWWTNKAWHNKLYRAGRTDGSYDMELFTQTNEQCKVKTERGQYLGFQSLQTSLYDKSVRSDPDTLTGYMTVPTDQTNYYTNVYQLLGNGSAYMWFISANSPHKEQALRFFNYMCDPDFVREICMGQRGVTWEYDEEDVPQMTEYGREQLDAFLTGNASADNYYLQWGHFSSLPNNLPLLRDNMKHPDGTLLDFVTLTREYAVSTVKDNISRDVCEHYGAELPTDAHYQAGGLDFRNDCGEAISSSIYGLNRDQLRILSAADAILDEVAIDLILAESDEEYRAVQEETIRRLTDLGEPEVFKAYQEKWDAAAAIIVPLVYEAQAANGIGIYTPEQYDRGQYVKNGDDLP